MDAWIGGREKQGVVNATGKDLADSIASNEPFAGAIASFASGELYINMHPLAVCLRDAFAQKYADLLPITEEVLEVGWPRSCQTKFLQPRLMFVNTNVVP